MGPHSSSPQFRQAVGFFQSGNFARAQALLHTMHGNPDAAHLMGLISYQSGNYAEAIEHIKRAILIDGANPDYYCHLGMAYARTNRLDEVTACFRQAIAIQPDHIAAHNNLATALRDQGELEQAVAAYRATIALKPDYVLAYNNLGNVLYSQRKLDEAAACFETALALQPDFVDAQNNLGNVRADQSRPAEAEHCYLRALAQQPDSLEANNNLGNVYLGQGRINEAIACFERASALRPDMAQIQVNLGKAFFFQGRMIEAVARLQKAIALDASLAVAHNNLGAALNALAKPNEAIESYKAALALKPDYPEAYSNLLLTSQYSSLQSPSEQLKAHLAFAERFEAPLIPAWQPHSNEPDPARRLRIGYVSADFRRHPVAYFIEPVLAAHDKAQVEVFCYYNHSLRDSLTDQIQSHADHWLQCAGLSDEQLAQRIRNDRIDILVDLSGHTASNRLLAFARKPAPLQLTYLGYPGTTGLAAMDYRLTDWQADPPGAEQYYREKLLRMPDSLCCYPGTIEMPQASPLPALKNGYLTFGSFNNFNKIDRQSIELWAKILCALPGSRLLMVTVPEGESRQWLTKSFGALGVEASRLEFHGILPVHEFHRMFQRVDVAVDPLLITGGTTTCESLRMGVPVIVLIGERYINRVGYSFLYAAGLAQYAAASLDDYVRLAVDQADRLPQLAQLRQGMRAQLAASPLMDRARFTKNLEKNYRAIWEEWCASGPA